MKPLITTLSAIAVGGLIAGTAFAGPTMLNPPQLGKAAAQARQQKAKSEPVQIAVYRSQEATATATKPVAVTPRAPSTGAATSGYSTIQRGGRMAPQSQ